MIDEEIVQKPAAGINEAAQEIREM